MKRLTRALIYTTLAWSIIIVVKATSSTGQYLDWVEFKSTFHKNYDSNDEKTRHFSYTKNLEKIIQHNQQATTQKHSFKLDVNHLADLSNDEFSSIYLGVTPPKNVTSPISARSAASHDLTKLPSRFDWRDVEGCVTAVKDQGVCGLGWAFSATGSLECTLFRVFKRAYNLSEQNILDCASTTTQNGCENGWITDAFEYMKSGIMSAEMYPNPYDLNANDSKPCMFAQSKAVAFNKNYHRTDGTESGLKLALLKHGPIAVALYASANFQLYKSGVLHDSDCNTLFATGGDSKTSVSYEPEVNHAVLIVGYGNDPVFGDYWVAKNSFGSDWGEAGFIRIAKNQGLFGMCNLAAYAYYPQVSTN